MNKILSGILLAATTLSVANAQITYPSAFSLASGNYTFNNWPATSSAATYPTNMGFYRLGAQSDPLLADTIYQDYVDAYNTTSGTRIKGLGGAGFSMVNTGTAGIYKLGASIVALDANGRENISVTWTGKTISGGGREYEIRLFYRVGNTGAWTPVVNAPNDTVRYVRSATSGDSVVKGPVILPQAANNQPLVQVCWKYFQTATNTATGTRPELGINNINISSSAITSGSASLSALPSTIVNTFIANVNTTSLSDSFTISGSGLTDKVFITAPPAFEISSSLAGAYVSADSLTPSAGTLAPTTIYVRFHPTTTGTASGNMVISSTGAAGQNVSVNGSTPLPTVAASTPLIPNTFIAVVNGISASDTFSVAGSMLTGDITLTAPSSFELATSPTGTFSASLTLAQTGGTVAQTLIYARFHPTATGSVNDTIKITSAGAAIEYVRVFGNTINATNPQAFNLATGNYALNSWDSASAAGTYPPNMIFHTATTAGSLHTTASFINNWKCAYNLTARSRIKGLNANGFSFINTGSAQYDDCQSGSASLNSFAGAALLAINTMNVTGINLQFDAGTVKQSTGATPKIFNIQLQYRMDSVGLFADMNPATVYTTAGKTDGDVQNFSVPLPAIFENKPYVEFRWVYYEDSAAVGTGTRPEMRIDNINVSTATNSIQEIYAHNGVSLYPNPVRVGGSLQFSEPVTGIVRTIYGKSVMQLKNQQTIDGISLAPGLYFITVSGGKSLKFVVE